MNNLMSGLGGAAACLLAGSFFESLPAAISVICTCAITAVTCFVQLYRLWRDRDNDIKKVEKSDKDEEDKDNV